MSIPNSVRDRVRSRAGYRCEFCRIDQDCQVATFPVDHVIPVVLGGSPAEENLCLACPRCNASKWTHVSAFDAETGEIVPLFNPRTDVWSKHFRWSPNDDTVIEGLSPQGRATVALLDLNAPRCVAIRKWLSVVGRHPA